jgi:hypothetical protein
MKLFKTTLILISLWLISLCTIQAQSLINSDATDSINNQPPNKKVSLLSPNRMNFKLDMGVGFVGGSNSGMYTFLAPYLRYAVTPKFKLDVGGIITEGTNSFYPEQSGNHSNTSVLLFARGNYLLTNRITVSGSIYKTFYPNSSLSTDLNNKYSTQNYSYSLGMDYKINKHLSFGAQVIVNKGMNNNYLFQSQPSLFGGSPYETNHNGIFGW